MSKHTNYVNDDYDDMDGNEDAILYYTASEYTNVVIIVLLSERQALNDSL